MDILRDTVEVLKEVNSKPHLYLSVNESHGDKLRRILKSWHDSTRQSLFSKQNKLILDNFDDEQIWQQLELINPEMKNAIVPILSTCWVKKKLLSLPKVKGDCVVDDEEKDDGKNEASSSDELEYDENVELSDEEAEIEENQAFFDEKSMGRLLDQDKDISKSDEDSNEDENDELDDAPSDLSDSEPENEPERQENTPEKKKWDSTKSTFEKRSERLEGKISKLEDAALQEKPWQLKGEVDASGRPINSLLEEYVEFDMTQRPAPVITEQVTFKLEDIILKRIKDKCYDDVERKVKPIDTPQEFKKKMTLDQEKSKLSLAEVYEQDYLNQKDKTQSSINGKPEESEMTEEKKEIQKAMKTLFTQLDCLSNFHYTPKMAEPDIKIVSNLPALTMEEPTPEGMADSKLLAPGEIAGKFKRDLKGKDERTTTDKKRERRLKKKLIRRINSRKKASGTAVQVKKGVKMLVSSNDKALKSSTQFFNKLQDEVQGGIRNEKRRLQDAEKNKTKEKLNAKRLKL